MASCEGCRWTTVLLQHCDTADAVENASISTNALIVDDASRKYLGLKPKLLNQQLFETAQELF